MPSMPNANVKYNQKSFDPLMQVNALHQTASQNNNT
jgi:hypothetical protein